MVAEQVETWSQSRWGRGRRAGGDVVAEQTDAQQLWITTQYERDHISMRSVK